MVLISERSQLRTSKLILNRNAIQFKQNVEHELKMAKLQRVMNNQNATTKPTEDEQIDYEAGARYECIYKIFMREIRQFYS